MGGDDRDMKQNWQIITSFRSWVVCARSILERLLKRHELWEKHRVLQRAADLGSFWAAKTKD